MSLFIFSVLGGLLLHQIVSAIQPNHNTNTYTFGRRIVVELPEKTYLVLKVVVFVVAILLFLSLVTIIIAQSVHPAEGYAYRFADALTSPRMGAAIFGGLVGILLGNLLNGLLKNEDDYQFKSSDYLEIALIFMLVILGIGGEEVLRSYAQRINKISVGTTTEISFSEASPKSSRASAEQPGGAFRNTQGDSGGSAGLEKLYDIGSRDRSNISRDRDFIEVLARYESEATPKPIEIGTLAGDALSPIGSCLSGIFRLNGDVTFIEQQLVLMSEPLRELAAPNVMDTEAIRSELSKAVQNLAKYTKPKLQAINTLGERYSCAAVSDTARKSVVDQGRNTLRYCIRVPMPHLSPCQAGSQRNL
jgi:hypothetical protein